MHTRHARSTRIEYRAVAAFEAYCYGRSFQLCTNSRDFCNAEKAPTTGDRTLRVAGTGLGPKCPPDVLFPLFGIQLSNLDDRILEHRWSLDRNRSMRRRPRRRGQYRRMWTSVASRSRWRSPTKRAVSLACLATGISTTTGQSPKRQPPCQSSRPDSSQ